MNCYINKLHLFWDTVLFNLQLVGGDERVHTFSKGISPKVKVIAQLEIEPRGNTGCSILQAYVK